MDYKQGWFRIEDPTTSEQGWIYEKYIEANGVPGQAHIVSQPVLQVTRAGFEAAPAPPESGMKMQECWGYAPAGRLVRCEALTVVNQSSSPRRAAPRTGGSCVGSAFHCEMLITLHINTRKSNHWLLERIDVPDEKANSWNIQLDSETQLTGVPAEAWTYRLGN